MANRRLIDANALTDACRKTLMVDVFPNWKNMTNNEKNVAVKLGAAFKRIHNDAPTVDAVELPCKIDDDVYIAPFIKQALHGLFQCNLVAYIESEKSSSRVGCYRLSTRYINIAKRHTIALVHKCLNDGTSYPVPCSCNKYSSHIFSSLYCNCFSCFCINCIFYF